MRTSSAACAAAVASQVTLEVGILAVLKLYYSCKARNQTSNLNPYLRAEDPCVHRNIPLLPKHHPRTFAGPIQKCPESLRLPSGVHPMITLHHVLYALLCFLCRAGALLTSVYGPLCEVVVIQKLVGIPVRAPQHALSPEVGDADEVRLSVTNIPTTTPEIEKPIFPRSPTNAQKNIP